MQGFYWIMRMQSNVKQFLVRPTTYPTPINCLAQQYHSWHPTGQLQTLFFHNERLYLRWQGPHWVQQCECFPWRRLSNRILSNTHGYMSKEVEYLRLQQASRQNGDQVINIHEINGQSSTRVRGQAGMAILPKDLIRNWIQIQYLCLM